MKINMKKIFFFCAAFLLFHGGFINAQEDAEQSSSGAEEAARARQVAEETRLATIKYGTETEIAALIQNLKDEGADYLDDELVVLAEKTRNQKILSGVFAFFGEREKSGLEERAMRAISERDTEMGETVLSAVDYLGKVKARQALPVLKELLDSEERRFMNTAFRALGRAGGDEERDETCEYLVDYYTNGEPGDENRRDILIAVGETRSSAGVEFLAGIAGDSDQRLPLRMAALESLAKIGDDEGLEAILEAVTADDPNLRASAVAALGPFSGENVDLAILEAFRDSFYRTRLAAAQASRERRLEVAVPYLKFRAERDDVPQVKDEAIRALGAIANHEANEIINALFTERKNSDRVRLVAAEALMKNEPGQYLDQLIIELDEAKKKNQNPLYNGFLKILGESRDGGIEAVTRRLMTSGGIIEMSYALDMAANNNLTSLSEEIKKLAENKNESIARKARRTMEKLGIE
ncbi:MAG TPA: hypothetical protein DEQ14_05585 [Treponema sp.]|nr:hypothetical protein [Treponema sp.]